MNPLPPQPWTTLLYCHATLLHLLPLYYHYSTTTTTTYHYYYHYYRHTTIAPPLVTYWPALLDNNGLTYLRRRDFVGEHGTTLSSKEAGPSTSIHNFFNSYDT